MSKARPEIRAEVSMNAMGDVVRDAFTLAYVMPEWRAMSRRLYYRFRADYEEAKAEIENVRPS